VVFKLVLFVFLVVFYLMVSPKEHAAYRVDLREAFNGESARKIRDDVRDVYYKSRVDSIGISREDVINVVSHPSDGVDFSCMYYRYEVLYAKYGIQINSIKDYIVRLNLNTDKNLENPACRAGNEERKFNNQLLAIDDLFKNLIIY